MTTTLDRMTKLETMNTVAGAENPHPLYHDPAQMRRAEVLDRHDAEQSGYTRMYRRALAAEAERDDLLAEVERLRGMLNAMYDEGHIAA